mgnify:FL=1
MTEAERREVLCVLVGKHRVKLESIQFDETWRKISMSCAHCGLNLEANWPSGVWVKMPGWAHFNGGDVWFDPNARRS